MGAFKNTQKSSTTTNKQSDTQSKSQPTKSSQSQSPSSPSSSSTSSQPSPTAKASGSNQSGSSTLLQTPFGQFVSNQNPSLSNPSQQLEESVCETTPGANCYIQFTKSESPTITLPTQVTNSQGVASWSWNLSNEGFTTGTWQVTAIATLGSQTKSASETLTVTQ